MSPKGNDAGPGTKDEPFRTLARARDALRTSRKKPSESEVILRSGSYVLNKTFVLKPEDSDTTYKAFPGEIPVVTGGRIVKGWQPLEEGLPEINGKAKGKLWVAAIPKGWRELGMSVLVCTHDPRKK